MQFPFRNNAGRGGWWGRPVGLLMLLVSSMLGSFLPLAAQTITQAEYYLDSPDPGFGAASPIPLSAPAADLANLSFAQDVSSLGAGFHRLTVRTKDASGQWSLSTRRTFYYEPLAATAANVTKVEYFVDTDPGFGLATDVPVTAGQDLAGVTFSLSVSSLGTGFHTVGVRTKAANGQWSLTTRRPFYYEPAATAAVNITKAEYFIDTDPGFGAATDVPVTAPGPDVSGLAFTYDVSGLATGFHQLGVRTRDAGGQWSLTTRRTFYFEPAAVATVNVTKVEYFIDADPGFGSGTDVPITAGLDVAGVAISIPVGALSTGFHQLSVRSRDAGGKWSLTTARPFYYEPLPVAAPNLTKIEYYFDTDPGFGSATDVPVATPAAELPGFGFLADASALADGPHRFFVRTRDANGKWSLVTSRSFLKNGCASSANFAAGLPANSYNYGGSTNGLSETAFNTDPASPNTSNSFYGYNGSLLQADLGTAQTISEVRYKLTPSNTSNFTLLLQTAPAINGTFTTVDTYPASFAAGTTTPVVRTLATPVSARVLRLVIQNAAGQYAVISGAGAYYFNCAGPTVTSFTPAGGAPGTSVVITGTNLTGATAVTFNGTAASGFVVNSATQITVAAPASGTTGQICVTTPGGTACSAASYAYPPTIATGTVSPASFCSTTFISVPFSTNTTAYLAGNQFKFQLSDANGVFSATSRLYGITSSQTANGGVLTDTLAFRTPAGSGYRIRVVATNPATTGTDNGMNLTVRGVPVATASATQTTVPYNGTIQLQAGPAGQSSYQWYVQYTTGGTGYVGNGATLSLSNAQPAQSGRYFVYVQNSAGCQDSASVRVTVQPNAQPILAMSQFSYTGCTGGSLNIGFAVTGNAFASDNAITAQLSDASGSFAAPTSIGAVNFSGQGAGSVSVTFPATTPTGTGYRVRLVGSNPGVTSQTDNGSNISLSDLTAVAATANAPLLPGQTLQLDVTGAPGGSSFAWSGPNGFSSSQRNPQLANTTAANSGTYQVVVTYASCTATRTVGVLVGCSNGPNLAASLPAANYAQSSTYNGSAQSAFNGGSWYDAFAGAGIITARFTSPQQVGAVRTTIFKTYNQSLPSYQAELSFDGGTTWQSTGPAVAAQGFDGTVFTWALPGGVRTGVTAIRLTQTVSGAAGCAWINVAVLDDACAPTLLSFTPAGGPAGTAVSLTGTGFTGATQVSFGGVAASSFVVNSATSITVTAPANGVSGPLTVVTPNGSASSTTSYVYPPVLTLTTFGGSLCGGQQRTLSFTATAGSFAAGNTLTAQLSDASGSFAAATVIGTLAGFTGPGTGSITATIPAAVTSGAGYRVRLVASDPATSSNDNGANLTINPVPTAAILTNNSPVATGGTVTLTAQAVSGASYAWSVPGFGNVSTGSSPTLNFSNATTSNSGTYSLTVTLGSCTATTSAPVTVNPSAPTLTLNANAARQTCAGNSLSLSFTVDGSGLTAGGTVSAELSDDNGSFAAATVIGTRSFSGPGTNSVNVTVPATAATGSLYRVRLVSTNPALTSAESGLWSITNLTGVMAASNSPVAAGGTIQLTSAGVPSGASLQWTGPNGFVSSQSNPQIQNAAQANAGGYTLNVSQGGCTVERSITVTIGQPVASISTGQFAGSYCPGSVVSVPFSTQGVFGAGNVFTALLSDASGSFAAATSIGTLSLSGPAVSGSISATIPAGAAVGTGYRIRVDASSPATVSSNDNGAALAVQTVSYTWTGGFSSNWFDARNWSCGQVPTASSNVIIGPGSFYPVVTGTGAVVNNITVVNGASFQVSSTFTIYGNVISNGNWVTGGAYVFAGAGPQTVGGSSAVYFGGVTVNSGSTLSLNTSIYVSGNWLNYGGFVGGTYFVNFDGTAGQIIGGTSVTNFYSVVVSNTLGSVSLNQNIYVLGNWTNNGATSNSFVGGTYVTTFGGTVNQLIGGTQVTNFGGLTILNTTGGVTLNTGIGLGGAFVNNGSFVVGLHSVAFNGTVAQTIGGSTQTNFYDVVINNTVGVSLVANIYVRGDWINNGQFVASTNAVYFTGTTAQIIGGTQVTNFYDVTFQNLVSVTLHQNIYVLGGFVNTGVFYGYYLTGGVPTGYFVRFGGSTAQVITANQTTYFWHFYVDNAAGVSLTSNIYVAGNYYLYSGSFLPSTYTVYFNGLGGYVQTVGGYTSLSFYGWNIGSLTEVRLRQNVTWLGSFVNNGVFYGYDLVSGGYTGYTCVFGGSTAQVVGGTGTYNFWHVTWNNLVSVTLQQNVYVLGNWINLGGFAHGGYTVYFTGTVAQTIGGAVVTAFQGITCNNAAGVSLLNDIRVRGDFRNLALFAAGAHTVYFDGAVAQGIYCPSGTLSFHDVTFANAAGVTLYDNIFVTGNWLNNGGFVGGGKLVTFSGTVLQTIGGSVATVFHHLTLASGATVRIDRAITLLGNWLNQGATFAANGFVVLFNGTVAQTIGGTALTVFHHLTLSNPVGVSLDYDVDLTGNFVNTGIFCGCGRKTRFTGTLAQTITCTSGNTRFHDLTFDNAAGVTLLDAIAVTGNWVNNAGFLANGQLVLFNGTVLQTIGGTALTSFWNIQLTNAVNVQLLRDIVVGGYWLNSGLFSGNGYLVTFNGPAQQTITTTGATAKTTFHHVTWANAVGCVLGGDIYVTGNWLCNGPFNPATYTVYFTGTVAQTLGGPAQMRFHGLNVQNTVGLTCNGAVYHTGNLTNGGLVNVGSYPWYCVGTAAQTLGGTTSTPLRFYDLLIQNGAGVSLGSAYGVTHLLTLTSGNLASDGYLTLHSNAAGTAMVVNPVGGGLVTGRSTMERFITGVATTGYRHYASPMQLGTATVGEFADDLPVFELNPAYNTQGNTVSPFPTFYQYDETRLNSSANFFDRGWMVPTAADNLVPMRGYSAMTDPTTTVDISGVLQNGNVTMPLSRGGQSGSGWNLLGNPYPAPIDWDLVPAVTGMDKAMYVFVPSGRYTGSYRSYVNGVGQNGGSKDLAAMQGFFVRATGATATVNLTNAVRHTSYLSPAFDRQAPTTGNPATAPKPLLRLEARNAQGQADETVLYFDPQAGQGYQANFDAYKVQLNGNGRPSLWSKTATDALSINGLPALATAGVVPLGLRVSQNGPHTLVLTAMQHLPAGTQVVLEDRLLNRRQDLALDSVYAFSMHPDSTRQRFFLWFQPRVTSTSAAQLTTSVSLFPNPTHGAVTLTVAGLREQRGTLKMEVLNTIGQVVRTLQLPVRQGLITQELDLRELPTGVYTLRLHTNGGTVVRRLVKN